MEGLVGYARRNFMVPVPRAASWEEMNAQLLEPCRKRGERKLRGEKETIGERFERHRERLLPLLEEFRELRRQMEARLGKRGRREYVQVLRLMETFSLAEVSAAIRQAQRLQAISVDAVKHLVLCAIEQRPPRLELENYPHLPAALVALTRAADYQVLMPAGAE